MPQDGCYYVPLACRGLWVGARVEAADHEHAHLAGCTLLLDDVLVPAKGGDEEDDSAEEERRSLAWDRPNGDDEDDGEEEEVAEGISIDDCRVGPGSRCTTAVPSARTGAGASPRWIRTPIGPSRSGGSVEPGRVLHVSRWIAFGGIETLVGWATACSTG